MENKRSRSRGLWWFIAFIAYTACGFASDAPLPRPIASLAFPGMQSSCQEESPWATIAFSSETSIAVGLCQQASTSKTCSLTLVQWEGGVLRPFAQTPRFSSGLSIHPASDGQIIADQRWFPTTVVYSADLSRVHDSPKHLSVVSPSGKTVAEQGTASWKLYRVAHKWDPLRGGTGDIRAISDEAVVIQDGKAMKIETLDGRRLGSFSLSDEVSGFHAGLLGNSMLYLPDCRRTVRIVDFAGKTRLKIRQSGLCGLGDTGSSFDGRRMLLDFTDHKTSGLRHMLENVQTISTFGMIGPEDFNREDVRVIDTVTGGSCFEWHRSFPMTYSQLRSAAISPSGEFVAIANGGKLSIYRLPSVCGGQMATSHR